MSWNPDISGGSSSIYTAASCTKVPCATLAANKFAKMMRKCKRDPSIGEFFLCVLKQSDELDITNIDE